MTQYVVKRDTDEWHVYSLSLRGADNRTVGTVMATFRDEELARLFLMQLREAEARQVEASNAIVTVLEGNHV